MPAKRWPRMTWYGSCEYCGMFYSGPVEDFLAHIKECKAKGSRRDSGGSGTKRA